MLSFVQVPVPPAWWNVRLKCPEGMHKVCGVLTAVKERVTLRVSAQGAAVEWHVSLIVHKAA